MNNFEHATSATATSMDSAGSATQENSRYMESLNASTQQLKATFQELANNVIDKELVKGALSFLNSTLELLDSTVGHFITRIGLLTGVLTGVFSIGGTIATKISGMTASLLGFGAEAATAAAEQIGFMGVLGKAVTKAVPYAAALSAIITVVYSVIKAVQNAKETLESVQEDLQLANSELEENESRLKELAKTPWYDRSPEIAAEVAQLERENKELQNQIDKLAEREKILKAEEDADAGDEQTNKQISIAETTASGLTHTYTLDEWKAYLDGLRQASTEYADKTDDELEQILLESGSKIVRVGEDVVDQLIDKLSRGAALTNQELDAYYELISQLDAYRQDDGTIDVSGETADTQAYINSLYELEQAYVTAAANAKTYAEQVAYVKSKDATNQEILNKAVENGLTTQEEYNNMIKVYTDYGMSYSDALAAVADRFRSAASAIGALTKASDLANDTVKDIIKQLTYAQTAYNSFVDDSTITIDALTDIKDGFSDVAGIDTYIDRLGAAGNTAEDVREILGELVEAKVKATLSTEDLAYSEETVIAKMLEDSGVSNSLEVATRLITEAKYELAVQNGATNGTIQESIEFLQTEKNASNDVRIAFVNLVAQEQVFNSTTLDVSQKLQALSKLYAAANLTSKALSLNSDYASFASSYIQAVGSNATEEEILNAFNQYSINKLSSNLTSDVDTGVTFKPSESKTKSGGSSSKSTEDTKLTALKEAVELRKSELELMDAQDASDTSRIEKIREIIKALQNQIDYMKKSGASQSDINALIKEQLEYEDKIKDIYNEIIEAQKEALETRRDNLKSAFSTITDMAQDELEKIETLEDEINQKYDDKLDALNEANDALNDQIELEEKLEALAKAKTSKNLVYSNGQFVYMDDVDAISEAQAELDALNREREQEQQEAEIEAQRKQELIDNRIEERKQAWQDYIDLWGNVVDNYDAQQDRLLASQVFGIDLEAENWQERLKNAQDFVEEYANIMSQISTIENIQSAASSGGGITVDPSVDYSAKMLQAKDESEFLYWSAYRDAKIQQTGSESKITSGKIRSNEQLYNDWKKSQGYAVGTYSSKSGLAMLGENGPELGVLKGGTGIIPSDVTKNLWAWGTTTPAQMMYALDAMSGQTNGGVSMNNVVLEFPNVRDGNDAKDFVTSVVNLAYQKAYKRA